MLPIHWIDPILTLESNVGIVQGGIRVLLPTYVKPIQMVALFLRMQRLERLVLLMNHQRLLPQLQFQLQLQPLSVDRRDVAHKILRVVSRGVGLPRVNVSHVVKMCIGFVEIRMIVCQGGVIVLTIKMDAVMD